MNILFSSTIYFFSWLFIFSWFFYRFAAYEGLYFSIIVTDKYTDRGDACRLCSGRDSNLVLRLCSGRDSNLVLRWTLGFLPHTVGLPSFRRFYLSHYCLWSLTPFAVNLVSLTDMLDNHTGVMPASVRTIVSTPALPRRASNSPPHHWH